MVRFGIVGTNSISKTFMDASNDVEEFSLEAVYSRSEETGRAFAEEYGVSNVYTSLEDLANDPDVDAVYIASPNSCHGVQAIQMLKHGKHVLCEKPVASSLAELEQMIEAAMDNHVIVLEAMRSVFDPGFEKIKELLPLLGTVRRVEFQYSKYSSRYDKFKEGVAVNAFNPALANAAVMDLGVYCVHPMVALFGSPVEISAASVFLTNGMEGTGTVIAGYPGMQAVLQYSKISNSFLGSQIQGEAGTMVIREIADTREIDLYLGNEERKRICIEKRGNNMYYEICAFIGMILDGGQGLERAALYNRNSWMEMQVLDEIRAVAGIRFDQ